MCLFVVNKFEAMKPGIRVRHPAKACKGKRTVCIRHTHVLCEFSRPLIDAVSSLQDMSV